jgi:hypothetical protein
MVMDRFQVREIKTTETKEDGDRVEDLGRNFYLLHVHCSSAMSKDPTETSNQEMNLANTEYH